MQECTDAALKECEAKGGKDYTYLYKSAKAGWWAFVNGTKSDGRIVFKEEADMLIKQRPKVQLDLNTKKEVEQTAPQSKYTPGMFTPIQDENLHKGVY